MLTLDFLKPTGHLPLGKSTAIVYIFFLGAISSKFNLPKKVVIGNQMGNFTIFSVETRIVTRQKTRENWWILAPKELDASAAAAALHWANAARVAATSCSPKGAVMMSTWLGNPQTKWASFYLGESAKISKWGIFPLQCFITRVHSTHF